MTEVLIALDQGSGSSRALALDTRGRIFAKAQRPLKTFYPESSWVEHDAEEIRRSQEWALDHVLAKIPKAANIIGLGLSCQRSTIIVWDSKSGRPLSRALSWQDGRAAQVVAPLQGRQQEIHEKTGLYANPYYSAPKLQWLLENNRKVREAADRGTLRAGPVASYLLWRWTRGEVFATDSSLAQRMLLLNARALDWDDHLLSAFGISKGWLPKIAPSCGSWGLIKRKGREIPILAVLGDQQAAALGLGSDAPGSAIVNYGTGAFFLLNTGTENRRVPGLLTSVAWQSAEKSCHYFLEGTVHAAGTAFEWLKDNLGLMGDVKNVDALCRKSRQRLLVLMAIGGLGAPRWDYSTFTTFMGMTSRTRPEDVVRAVTEGIAFLVTDIVSAIRSAGLKIDSVRSAGGLSRLDYLQQFQSDLLQCPIERMRETEASALGMASLVARQLGMPWPALSAPIDRQFAPKLPSQESQNLLNGWRQFVLNQQKLSSELRGIGILS